MIINKPFWSKKYPNGVHGFFSYDNPVKAAGFAEKWGGEVLNSLELESQLPEGYELASLITNKKPSYKLMKYSVYLEKNNELVPIAHFETIGDANSYAKSLAKMETRVLVLKRCDTVKDDIDLGVYFE